MGPTMAGMATKLSAGSSRSWGKLRRMTSRPTGISIAPPAPWTTREATSWLRSWEIAHSTEPSVNRTMAEKYTLRVPKRSASQPEAGISTAMVSA